MTKVIWTAARSQAEVAHAARGGVPCAANHNAWGVKLMICVDTVDGRNPKQPPAMYKTL